MTIFKGSAVALVTPFYQDGSVNFEKFEELLEFHISHGTDAILVNGTTGESPNITEEEFAELVKRAAKKIDKRVPLIAGTGSNSTAHSLKLSLMAEELGADALLIITPYYNKATPDGILKHFLTVADAVDLPIILYNVPGRTAVNLTPEVVYEASRHKNIVAVKEASGNISQVLKIRALCGEDFGIYSGNDDIIIPTLASGGIGVISVLANILPQETHDMVIHHLDGRQEEALAMQVKYNELIEALFTEPNPIAVKEAMNLIGMEAGPVRLPLTPLSKSNQDRLENALRELKLM